MEDRDLRRHRNHCDNLFHAHQGAQGRILHDSRLQGLDTREYIGDSPVLLRILHNTDADTLYPESERIQSNSADGNIFTRACLRRQVPPCARGVQPGCICHRRQRHSS